jgi:hypothetical protein
MPAALLKRVRMRPAGLECLVNVRSTSSSYAGESRWRTNGTSPLGAVSMRKPLAPSSSISPNSRKRFIVAVRPWPGVCACRKCSGSVLRLGSRCRLNKMRVRYRYVAGKREAEKLGILACQARPVAGDQTSHPPAHLGPLSSRHIALLCFALLCEYPALRLASQSIPPPF